MEGLVLRLENLVLGLEVDKFRFEASVFYLQLGEAGVDGQAVAGAGSMHTFLDSTFEDEAFFQTGDVVGEHLVSLMSEGDGKVSHLLVVHRFYERGIIAEIIMLLTESK